MNYAELDIILIPWSQENSLELLIEDEGEQVRKWIVLDPSEWEYHLWIEIQDEELSIHAIDFYVHALEYPKINLKNLKDELSKALSEVRNWIDENAATLKKQKGFSEP